MPKLLSNFIKQLYNDSIEYYQELDNEIVFDYCYKFNGATIYGSIDIGIDKYGYYQIFESDISVPFKKVNIPEVFEGLLEEIDVHDWDPDYHHHFITLVPVSFSRLKAILKFFYKLYLFGEWDDEE